eukprot:CAMPEP_0206458720 /NCGR_PEP_ID=MMETSP0324_2-20121206/23739_1 /ASSEMBLY_ACC=CAM_ASM_000836 /TAXON_ID=2866 /ORGANISM="Crypthecodinium cohnii, Strain Seligo" /LENGTH=154 /DNA_ID=CAMNT_0053930115 /DNA_START=76 /DNA_END=541 /DNA_ORIENTATION=+
MSSHQPRAVSIVAVVVLNLPTLHPAPESAARSPTAGIDFEGPMPAGLADPLEVAGPIPAPTPAALAAKAATAAPAFASWLTVGGRARGGGPRPIPLGNHFQIECWLAHCDNIGPGGLPAVTLRTRAFEGVLLDRPNIQRKLHTADAALRHSEAV